MMESNKKPHSKTVKRVSKSGRVIKTPKAILTTSSDEAPRQRSSNKSAVNVRTELQRLREIAKTIQKKTAVSEHDTATAAIKEPFQNISAENVATSTNIEQVDPNGTRNFINTSPPPGCSKIQTTKPKKVTNILSSISQSEDRGISPLPPRTELMNEPNMYVDHEIPIKDPGENREKSSEVDFNQVLNNLQEIVQQNKEIKQQFEDIKKQNLEIINQQKQILDGVGQQNIGEEMNSKLYEPLAGFPLKTIEQFQELENDSKKSIRKKLYVHLRNLGGSKVREFLNCALKEAMTDELVNSFTWPGGKGTLKSEKFGNTKVANVLYLAAKKCTLFKGPDTKTEFKAEMIEVLRTTKQRFRNGLKKLLKTDQEKKTADEDELGEDDQEQLLQKIRQLEERIDLRSDDENFDTEIEEDFDADDDTDDDH